MADDSHDLDIGINIRKTGDGAGAAAADLNATKDAAKQASGAVDEHGQKHESMRGKIRGTMDETRALSALLRGDFGEAISEAGRGMQHLIGSVSSFVGVGAIISVVVGALATMVAKWHEAVQKAEEARAKAQAYGDKVKAIAEEKALAEHLREIGEIKTKFEEATAAAQQLHHAEEDLQDAKTRLKLAQIDARENEELKNAAPEDREAIKMKYLQERVATQQDADVEKAQRKAGDASLKIFEAQGAKQAAQQQRDAIDATDAKQQQNKQRIEETLARHGIDKDDPARYSDTEREKKVAEFQHTADENDRYVKQAHAFMQANPHSGTPQGLSKAEKDAAAAHEAAQALRDYPEAVKNAEKTSDDKKTIYRDTDKTIAKANVDERAGYTEQQAALVDVKTANMSRGVKVDEAQRQQQDSELKAAERAEAEHQKDLARTRAAAAQKLREDKEALKEIAAGAVGLESDPQARIKEAHLRENVGSKASRDRAAHEETRATGDLNMLKNFEHAGNEANTDQMMKSLATMLTSKDQAIVSFAQAVMGKVKGFAGEIEELKAAIETIRNDG